MCISDFQDRVDETLQQLISEYVEAKGCELSEQRLRTLRGQAIAMVAVSLERELEVNLEQTEGHINKEPSMRIVERLRVQVPRLCSERKALAVC